MFYALFDWGFLKPSAPLKGTVTWGAAVDFNALYASCMTCSLPFDGYQILNEATNNVLFEEICQNLIAVNFEYFEALATERNVGMLITCDMTYDREECLKTSLDFSAFPSFVKVAESDLTDDQIDEAKKLHKNLSKEPAKLISTMSDRLELVDFIDNLLYAQIMMSCKVVRVKEVIMFKQSNYMASYMHHLQRARAKASSKIEATIAKTLGNSICG